MQLKKVDLLDERGSATVEFVALTLPLLVPFALYLTAINGSTQISYEAHTLARQMARAYVTSPSPAYTEARMNVVLSAHQSSSSDVAQYSVACSVQPCLTSGSKVTVTVKIMRDTDSVIASDTQVVDRWRNS
jgi:Flp pilus assembly protein TadG